MHTPHIVCLARISFGLLESKLIIEKNDEGASAGPDAVGNYRDYRVRKLKPLFSHMMSSYI